MLSTLFYCGVAILSFGVVLPIFGLNAGGNVRKASFILSAIASAILAIYAIMDFYTGGRITFFSYEILPNIAFSFSADRLSAFFIGLISVISFSAAIYSIQYAEHGSGYKRKNLLASLMGLFILSMILVVSSANTFTFLFFWELMSMSSFLLVMYEYDKPETRKAGLFYFIMTQVSTVFLLVGFVTLYTVTGSFDIAPVKEMQPALLSVVFLALFIGFGIKAGVIPFHKWLPYAHTASPSNISALMSGVMIKVAVYGMMRFVLDVLSPQAWWGILILVFGTVSAILGVIYALKEHDIKRLLAYHSIENIGIILIGFGLYLVYTGNNLPDLAALCLAGSLFHTLNHALFKSLLFLTAGSVVYRTGERNIEEMGGLVKKMPYTALFFLVGAVSISGLPPFNGFASELMIFQGLLRSYELTNPFLKILLLLCLAIFALMSALAAACFVKAFGTTFLANPRTEKAGKAREVGASMVVGPGILALFCIVLGLFSYQIFSAMGYDLPVPNLLFVGLLLLIFYVAACAFLYFGSSNKQRVGETWGCGVMSQTGRTEYTASGFSEPIVTIFKDIYRTKKVREASYFDRYQSLFREGRAEIHLMKFFEEVLYTPVARIVNAVSVRIGRLQNWNLDTYIAYAFIAVILIFVYVGWLI